MRHMDQRTTLALWQLSKQRPVIYTHNAHDISGFDVDSVLSWSLTVLLCGAPSSIIVTVECSPLLRAPLEKYIYGSCVVRARKQISHRKGAYHTT